MTIRARTGRRARVPIAIAAGLVLVAAACSGGGTNNDQTRTPVLATVAVEPLASAQSGATALPSRAAGAFPPGTVALFDLQTHSATKLDLGRSLIFADWVDNGKTLVALDVNANHWLALGVDGTPRPRRSATSTQRGRHERTRCVRCPRR